MLFWIFVIPLFLCLAFGIFIRVCVVIDDKRDERRWNINNYEERQTYRETCEDKLAHKVDYHIAGE